MLAGGPFRTNRGRVTIEWQLARANLEWANAFRGAGNRSGSADFVSGNVGEPKASSGAITWEVPEADLANADSYVRHSVDATNDSYRALQATKERQVKELIEKQKADADRLAKLQGQLDELD